MNIVSIAKQHCYESVCVILALVCLLALWPVSKLGSQAKAEAEKIQKLRSRALAALSLGPEGVANERSVEARQSYAQQVVGETEKVAELFRQKNEREFLVPAVFPDFAADAPWRFRARYNEAINKLLSETLRAGWPGEKGPGSDKDKSIDSSAIGIYAQRDNLSVGEWVSAPEAPTAQDCWFGQLEFWIQQDLAEVFEELNLASAKQRGQPPRVENAAVKRIISIYVDSYYYVGMQKQPGQMPSLTPGSLPIPLPSSQNRPNFEGQGPPMLHQIAQLEAMAAGQPPPLSSFTPTGPTVSTKSTAASRKAKLLKTLDKPFTERFCDEQADVLHFSFSVVVDSRRINELLAALSRKNLYTVLKLSLSRADAQIDSQKFEKFEKFDPSSEVFDPYDDVSRDLVYGTDPVIRLDVDVEALFLKEIYTPAMPNEVKNILYAETEQAKKQRQDLINARTLQEAAAAKAAKQKPKTTGRKSR